MRRAALALCLLAAGCGGEHAEVARHESPPRVVEAPDAIEPIGHRVQARIPIGVADVCSVVPAGDSVWVSSRDKPFVVRVDPARNRVSGRVRLPGPACLMTLDRGLLWIQATSAAQLVAIDPASGRIVRRARTENPCDWGFTVGAGWVWVLDNYQRGQVSRRDPRTGATAAALPEREWACGIAYAHGSLWLGEDQLVRVDPRSGRVVAQIDAGFDPAELVVALGDEVWVGNRNLGEMRRVDARSGRVAAIYKFGGRGIAADARDLWAIPSRPLNQAHPEPVLVRLDRGADRVTGSWRVGRRAPAEVDIDVAWDLYALGGPGLGFGSLWVAQNVERRLYRIDPGA
jgi:hypothetical protein